MKNFLSIFALSISFCSWTQITVTETDFPSGGDTALVSISNETAIDLVTTGSNATWDFSNISIDDQRIETFFDISQADAFYQFVFNNQFTNPDYASEYFIPWNSAVDFSQASALGLEIENPVNFTKVGPTAIEQVGFGMKINGIPVPAASDTVDIQYELPLNYSDSWISNSYTNLDLNPQFNGIYRRYQQRNSIVDGWGQITTPFKTYDVVRVKSLISSQDSVYVDLGFGGMWIELPTPDQIEYNWIANNEKVSVFKVVTQDIGGNETISTLEFKDKKRDFVSMNELDNTVAVYPNPANAAATVLTIGIASEIQLLDISGKLLKTIQPSSSQTTLDLSELNTGLYLVKIYSESTAQTLKLQVK